MLRAMSILFVAILATGCNSSSERTRLPTPHDRADGAAPSMAYERTLVIDVDEARLASTFGEVGDACNRLGPDQCELVSSRLTSGRAASASFRFRASVAGIDSLVADLSKRGSISEDATSAKDLAGPITDAGKNLAMLVDYRAKLEALQARSANDVDALIKLTRELARVQAEVEAATGTSAALAKRVERQILDVSLVSARSRSFWRPVAEATADFGSNLSAGLSSAITAAAYLVPWVILLGVFGLIARTLWRRRRNPVEVP